MNIIKHFAAFYFIQNILVFWLMLIPELIIAKDYKEELMTLKLVKNTIKIILVGVPLIIYESIKENY